MREKSSKKMDRSTFGGVYRELNVFGGESCRTGLFYSDGKCAFITSSTNKYLARIVVLDPLVDR